MPAVLEVIAEPNRRRILDLLRDGERPVGGLVEVLDLSQPAVSKHLRILRGRGSRGGSGFGQHRLYRLRPDGLRELDEWLAPYRALWADHLDALERVVDDLPDPAGRTDP